MATVLQVLSAARVWTLKDGTQHPTGFWAEEFVVPYTLFTESGWTVTLATPEGRTPVVDQLSLGVKGGVLPRAAKKLRSGLDSLASVLEHPKSLSDVDPADFDVVFYSGGHGPMEDLAVDETSGALITTQLDSGRPLALLCHAPAASLAARNSDGSWPFRGYKMTGLSNAEERLNPFAWKAKWLLEDRLKEGGADYTAGLPLKSNIVHDRNLYTGQNPRSSAALARRIIADQTTPGSLSAGKE